MSALPCMRKSCLRSEQCSSPQFTDEACSLLPFSEGKSLFSNDYLPFYFRQKGEMLSGNIII